MRRALALACAVLVSGAALGGVPAPSALAAPDDGEAVLRADADGPLRIRREGGTATFVGVPAGTDIDNPVVGRGTSVSAAARAHLARYGDAVGAGQPGTRLVEQARSAAAAGSSVVRYRQLVDGLPVLGGDVVVTLDGDRDLASLDAHLSDATDAIDGSAATVTEDDARATALATLGRGRAKDATAEDLGRWVLDPHTVPVAAMTEARSAWRFEVRAGADVRRMVLVDDRSGVVLLAVDLIQAADRVVCDRRNVPVEEPAACTSGFTRYEGGPASSVGDVNQAFVNAGRVSDFYAAFGNGAMADLTSLIGIATQSGKKLASSVRVCIKGIPCPFDNAFWDGRAMFYGAGYPKADDIVGHEMTHGVIERTSGLLYYDQSGAINESLADIVGEIIDHRHGTDDDSAFALGENIGSFRSMRTPGAHRQPDRMGSGYWYAGQEDSGGVHTNSGVGNKAFYLISQGGSFNGQVITGIDAGDPGLANSARLWTQVIATIPTFADYEDLATVLEQSCTALQGSGLTAEDCAAVHEAVLATEMTMRPASEPVRDAARTCPGTTVKRVLVDPASETDQAAFAAPSGGWTRTPAAGVPTNASSGESAWFGEDRGGDEPQARGHLPLLATGWVDLPAGQPAYLAFRHWHVFESFAEFGEYYDGGTVELVREGAVKADLEGEAWAGYAPRRTLAYDLLPGRKAFSGSSKGWAGSRVDLGRFAGQRVRPRFTTHHDELGGAPGWYVDDVEVYTCDIPEGTPELVGTPTLTAGTSRVGRRLTLSGVAWSDPTTVTAYQWRRNGAVIGGQTGPSYVPVAADVGAVLSVAVTGTANGLQSLPFTRSTTVQRGLIVAPRTVAATGTPYVGRRLTAVRGTWSPSGITFTYQWLRDGRAIAGATRSTFVIRRIDRAHRISVRVTGRKAGYTTVARTSA
ncbi:MAG TPA: M4 family metallopeptidase, partial [Nocardioides sp.]|nr:M4 family metallopeptidase [Nocardioides sp.]